jgi:hypothetical protein
MSRPKATAMPERGPSVDAPVVAERGLRRLGLLLVVHGVGFTAVGAASDPTRLAFGYLWGFAFVWTVVVGSLFFVGLQHLTRSVWSVVIRRVAEAIAAQIGLVALLFVPVLGFAIFHDTFHLFPWTDPAHVAGDSLLAGKQPYLDTSLFALRAVAYFAVWLLFAHLFVGRSLAQDRGAAGADATVTMRRRAPIFVLLFGVSVTFAAFDWLMSLAPHWFSTVFGVYVFAGMFVTALAVITLGVLYLRARGRLGRGLVRPDHLFVLGAFVFGMSCFWAYIAFSQFMLIWYGNLPEETAYYLTRLQGGWLRLSWLLGILRFLVPFFLLLGRPAKSDPRVLVLACTLVVAGQLLDLYWLVMPEVHRAGPALRFAETGPLLLMVGLLLLGLARFLNRHPAVAVRDPLLGRSLAHEL